MNSRRNFIKQSTLVSGAALTLPSFSFNILTGKAKAPEETVIGHGDYQYKVDQNWAKMSIAHNPLLNCHEMVMDSRRRLLMLGDHTDNNILVFDKSGKLLDYWGTSYPGGHGLTLSKEGDEDFLFITDSGYFQNRHGQGGKQLGRVVKTTIDGRLVMNLGDPYTIGVYNEDEPFMPTETAVGPDGDIYVADGYGSDYILQYDAKGQFIRRFGGRNNANKEHNLHNAHGVAIDYRDKDTPVLICTSRMENCFKYFTLEGEYIKTVKLPGLYVCRPVVDEQNIYSGVCWSDNRDGERTANSGFLTVMEGDQVVSNPGGTAPVYENGEVQTMHKNTSLFHHGHDVCVDDDKNLYLCQWNANQTPPVKLTRV